MIEPLIPNPDPTKYALTEHGYKPLPKVCPCCRRPYMPSKTEEVYCPACKAVRITAVEVGVVYNKSIRSRIV